VTVAWRDRLPLNAVACRLSGKQSHKSTQILIEAIDHARI